MYQDLPPGEFILVGLFKEVSTVIYTVATGLSKAPTERESEIYWIELIAKVLTILARENNAAIEPIEDARQRILQYGQDTLIPMPHLRLQNKNYLVEVEMQIKGYGLTAMLFAKATNLITGATGRRLILECNFYEIRSLAKRTLIKDETLVLKPSPNGELAPINARGFVTPVRVSLSKIFAQPG